MSFSEYLESAKSGEVSFDKSWSQGRAGFGGLVAALSYQNMVEQLSDDRPLRSLQVSFVGPVAADETFTLSSTILREGKSVTHVQGVGQQQDQVQLTVLGAFGHSRSSGIQVSQSPVMFEEKPEEQRSLRSLGAMVPAFTQHFDFRYCTALPFEGTEQTRMRGFIRFSPSVLSPSEQATSKIGIPELLALIDAWPPTPLPMLKEVAPASSLSWTVEFMHPLPSVEPEEYCQYEASIEHAENGYGHTKAKLWNSKGELIAISQQTVTIFA